MGEKLTWMYSLSEDNTDLETSRGGSQRCTYGAGLIHRHLVRRVHNNCAATL